MLRLGHILGLAFQKLDPAGGAVRVTAALVHDVYAYVLLDGQDQTQVLGDIGRSVALHFHFGHSFLLSLSRTEFTRAPNTASPQKWDRGRSPPRDTHRGRWLRWRLGSLSAAPSCRAPRGSGTRGAPPPGGPASRATCARPGSYPRARPPKTRPGRWSTSRNLRTRA